MSDLALQRPTYFRNLDPYEGVAEAELCTIAPTAVDRRTPKGTVLYSEHDPAAGIYVVKSGEVELSHVQDGKVTVFDTLGPGGVFGDFGFTGQSPAHTARTTRPSLLCITPVEEFMKIIAARPELMLRFMRRMAERIQDYEARLKTTSTSARERVYAELVRLQEKQRSGLLSKLRTVVPVRITHEALAEHTGLNRVTVTRALASLKDEGLVRQLPEGGYEVR